MPVVGWRLWLALVGSLFALAAFAHFAYGATVLDALIGILTTLAILVGVTFVAYLSWRGPT